MTTENERDRIAAAINALRPDWPVASLRTLLNRPELANRSRRDVAVALAWVACETASTTPARVIQAGPWWRAAQVEDAVTTRPPKRDEQCFHCGRWASACVCDGGPTSRPVTPDELRAKGTTAARDSALALARTALRTPEPHEAAGTTEETA